MFYIIFPGFLEGVESMMGFSAAYQILYAIKHHYLIPFAFEF